ncbi:neutral zinc metallopeptidase [Gordonia sp. HY002]|uniref:KPN_02809 family neutral zinc metallopeptidase n=1 Tax=Gordonia zhenghanii TaxID=2911516 RepID=UPI001EF0F448|nr:neutral zinc metallopeptidase [Gordonia zhenghanii]MCF8569739.1 neutral zinc metallopeptidase [Gordonia zhenghanii]MCF8603227.1 neutral zinc metallopeptidase [Gordonia zhenghanii]
MTFQGSGPLDTSGVSAGGGGGGGRIAMGGGLGLVVTVVALLFGVNPGDLMGGSGSMGSQQSATDQSELQQRIESCTSIDQANSDDVCRLIATKNSLNDVWPTLMNGYTDPDMKIFSGDISTGCGAASSAMGPFYCPSDETAYFDPSFFQELKRMGGSDGPLAQEYVVAHEFGHHIENLTGVLAKGQRMGNDGSVRIELQADCLAGVWAQHADDGPDAMLAPLTDDQIASVIQTAKAIGDDTIQGSGSNPEGWTHGSARQRQRWFTTGYQSGDPSRCDTFATDDL